MGEVVGVHCIEGATNDNVLPRMSLPESVDLGSEGVEYMAEGGVLGPEGAVVCKVHIGNQNNNAWR